MKPPLDFKTFLLAGLWIALAHAPAAAAPFQFSQPDFDRWNYPYNGSNGIRNFSPVFSGVGSEFDDRDGQFLLGFDTLAAGIAPGHPAHHYVIASAVVTATHFTGQFVYDSTYDSYRTYLEAGDPEYMPDGDAGRPVVLSGAGLRHGYEVFAFGPTQPGVPQFEEEEAFGGIEAGLRNAFAYSHDAPGNGDISSNVRNRFDFQPWAVAQSTSGLSPGDAVPVGVPGVSAGETFEFQIDLNNPGVIAYLQQGLRDGGIFLSITSLYPTAPMGGTTNPNFCNDSSNFDPVKAPATLAIDVTMVVPEPATAAVTIILVSMFIRNPR